MESSTTLLATIGIVLIAGCAGNDGPVGLQVGETPSSEPGIRVIIENATPSSVRAFALVGGSEISLGRVTALGSRTVRLPQSAGSFQLLVRPSAINAPGRYHASEMIQAVPGQRVTWQLQPSPGTSMLPRVSVVHVLACESAARC